jgi:hypothetical protein
MSPLPAETATQKITSINESGTLRRISAQVHAKYILKEVGELRERFPRFDPRLEERALFLAYALLSAGCSLEETKGRGSGVDALTRAASLLQEIFSHNDAVSLDGKFQLLIGGMAFYSAGQYSRAFVTMREASQPLLAGRIIRSFIQKDIRELILGLNDALLSPDRTDERIAASVDLDNPQEDWLTALATSLVARAISLHLESIYSGQGRADASIEVLNDAMTCVSAEDSPSWWWIMRLLKLMLRDGAANFPANLLGPYFAPDGNRLVQRYAQTLLFLSRPVFELWESQKAVLPLALSPTGLGGAISLRTSGGKTRVAEIAILKALASDPQAKAFYIAPFRALATEVEGSLSTTLEPLGFGVSQLYGGSVASRTDENIISQSRVIVATPEKIKSLFRYAPHLKDSVRLFIVDEGHLIGPDERLIRNEVFLEGLLARAKESKSKTLLLSAVLPNVEQIGVWIGGEKDSSAQSKWKPSGERLGLLLWNGSRVRLEWRGDEPSFNPSFIESEAPKKKRRKKLFPASKIEAVAATAVRLSKIGPVLVFTGMAKSVKGLSEAAMEAMLPDETPHDWPKTEWQVFEAACTESLGPNSIELNAARLGVIGHHAQLPSEVRFTIERLMRSRAPKIIVATTTLAQGVNIGVSSVIIANYFINQEPMSHRDFWNICGRAGRAFTDMEGKVLFAIDETAKPWQVHRDKKQAGSYFNIDQLEPAVSGLLQILRGLRSLAQAGGVDFSQLVEMAAENDFSGLGGHEESVELFCDFLDDEILALIDEKQSEDPDELIENNFRSTLAAIQAAQLPEALSVEELLAFFKARATATITAVPAEIRKSIVTSALPFRAAIKLQNSREKVKEIVSAFFEAEDGFEALCKLVAEFESLARTLPVSLTQEMPPEEDLEKIRVLWLAGKPLVEITALFPKALPITTRYYGNLLPWVMNGAAQQLRISGDVALAEELGKATVCVELGLPTESAVRVFLAGVMARSAATEIAVQLSERIQGPAGRELRVLLASVELREYAKAFLSETSLRWLSLLSLQGSLRSQPPPELPPLNINVDKDAVLHLRRSATGEVFLTDAAYKARFSLPSMANVDWGRAANDPRIVYRWSPLEKYWMAQCRQPPFDE